MIPSARSTVSPEAIIIFIYEACFIHDILKSGDIRTYVRTTRVKIMITTGGRQSGSKNCVVLAVISFPGS